LEKLAAAQQVDFPDELGEATLKAIHAYFAIPENRARVLALGKAVQPATPPVNPSRP
jgi:hypothetical protein